MARGAHGVGGLSGEQGVGRGACAVACQRDIVPVLERLNDTANRALVCVAPSGGEGRLEAYVERARDFLVAVAGDARAGVRIGADGAADVVAGVIREPQRAAARDVHALVACSGARAAVGDAQQPFRSGVHETRDL
eukprot:6180482-Pleurochrysis_carterae.AAC.2